MIRVLIVDGTDFVRTGLRAALSEADGILVVGDCVDGGQALAAVSAVGPDVVLMDRQMPVTSGVAATRAVLAAYPSMKVVMISVTGDEGAVREAAAAGAAGYLVKDGNPIFLIAAVRAVAAGIPVWPVRRRFR